MKVASVSEMRSMDQAAITEYGIPEMLLMENAGLASYAVMEKEVGITGRKFAIFCGIGNNGGDGFVLARKIHSGGGSVKVFLLGKMNGYKGSAKANLDILRKMPVEIKEVASAGTLKRDMAHCDGIVDAIFGTGLTRNVEGLHRSVIEAINACGKMVVSLDIPSGVNGDTGHVMGCAVRADLTVTFGLPKTGNLLFPGYDHCGSLSVTRISFPTALYDAPVLKTEVNDPPALPPRPADGNKGNFGKALFIAGAKNYYGAPYFAAMSFLKAGGGYSRLAAPGIVTPFIAAKGSEIVYLPQDETPEGSISLANKGRLLELAGKMDVVVIGPGLSLNKETASLVRELAASIKKPVILDADGITAVCQDLSCIRKRKAPTVLTPHMGEMSMITGKPVAELEKNRMDALREVCADLSAIIVLKGAHTLVGCPDGRIFMNMTGNPGMATAGSGDALTGTISAMYGLGLSLEDAVRKGVFIHGASGDLAADEKGEDGITAQDILDYLPQTMMLDREDLLAPRYALKVIL